MPRGITFERMSRQQLLEQRNRIDRALVARQDRDRVELRAKMEALAKQSGFKLSELVSPNGKVRRSVLPKYRDPENPENTWTGRGRAPRWMAGAKDREQFLIR